MIGTTPGASRDTRYDILLKPVRLGPVTAKNRFFQVPHCNGMGYRDPRAHAEMRRVKAEGGWAVVCTEQAEIHASSEITPFIEQRLWDDADIPALALMTEAVHEHGALAGIELAYNGMNGPNMFSRIAPMGPAHLPVATFTYDPVQARAMTKADIADLRRWHRQAVDRSLRAGFDLVYVYAGHAFGGIHHFLSKRYNDRTDEYGGSVENRGRLLREILEDTREQADGRAAVACRITVDELLGDEGFTRAEFDELLGLVGELPDVWDLVLGSWEDDSVTSRFGGEGDQESHVRGVKALTTKPVVGVGRFTSPDTMVRMVRDGVLDMIGAARPSIADPWLPRKIEEGRLEDIRECIGCNICVSGDFTMTPIRCTQNPAMGEEWRRGWHPERMKPKTSDAKVLVVGAGPAGLEAAQALGKRGYEVTVIEASRDLGGRVAKEARLPGLSAWIRVLDYRESQLSRLPNVEIYRQSEMTVEELLELGFAHVAIATGARWRADGVGRWHTKPMPIDPGVPVLTPDDLMAGERPAGRRVVLFDDDHYYLGGVLAELLAGEGHQVTLVTPAPDVSNWTNNTLEQARIQTRVLEAGVDVIAQHAVVRVDARAAVSMNRFTGAEIPLEADAVVLVTARLPRDDLVHGFEARRGDWADAGLLRVAAVGDSLAPGTIAAAVWEGRRFAEELEEPIDPDAPPFKREVTRIDHE
ncbi:MAG TPA: FAD-dependent oxidoreductase [Actinomycetota bacterium]|nr:FAD-dependent oxidoreductase [Actinomycetota bacterium]